MTDGNFKLRYYQEDAITATYDYIKNGGKNGIMVLPTACHRKGQKLIMYDGTLKSVEDIVVGDKLMGPDSKPRNVLKLCRGRQEMRRIIPKRFGLPFVVNKDHVLSLYKVREGYKFECEKAKIVNETVEQYQNSSAWHKHTHKLYHSGEIAFPEKEPLFDPYLVGLLIGDGSLSSGGLAFTNMDDELLDYVNQASESIGDRTSIKELPNNKAVTMSVAGGNLRRELRNIGLYGHNCYSKRIPQSYKSGSIQERKLLVAGIIDTDGYVVDHKAEITLANEELIDDIAFVLRSLGFSVTKNYKLSSCLGKTFDSWRLYVYGDMKSLPFVRKRHIENSAMRAQRKNVNCGFSVENLPEEDFYGFHLDGDHLYLLDDFTVTHNSGKTPIICELIKRTLVAKNHVRVMMLTHVKELIAQGYESMKETWPTAPCGIFSAGLNAKQHTYPITYAGIQSCYRHPKLFGHIDLLMIDEVHLVSEKSESMYGTFIAGLRETNPDMIVIGLTATPYRMKMGYLTDGPMFDDIYYDISNLDSFVRLIDEGYLCDLIPVNTNVQFDLSEVKKIAGEFSEKSLDENINRAEITKSVVAETMVRAQGRNKGMAFCVSISHAEDMTRLFNEAGLRAVVVHSNLKTAERDERIEGFRTGRYNMIVNVSCLCVGFNVPDVDYLVVARPTQSTGLHIQILGRGMRVHPSKRDTLVLDYAGNTLRLGPVNDPVIPTRKGPGGGEAPIRICPDCDTINHAAARVCKACGHEFPEPEVKIEEKAYAIELIRRSDTPKIFETDVVDVVWNRHISQNGNEVVKLTFVCGKQFYNMFLMFNPDKKSAYASSIQKWRKFGYTMNPTSVDDAMAILYDGFKKPDRIKIWLNKPVPGSGGEKRQKEILDIIYDAKD